MCSKLMELWNCKKVLPAVFNKRMQAARAHIDFAMRVAVEQIKAGRFFAFEQPSSASSWRLASVVRVAATPGGACVRFDMCSFGMRAPHNGTLIRKRTVIMTNHPGIKRALRGKLCSRNHAHVRIQGTDKGVQLSTWCQIYPKALVETIAQTLAH